jgi:DNA-3-methyladenine glycosylase I
MAERERTRCGWAAGGGPLEIAYHDREWGVPVHDDRVLFEFLILEGAQAGLSWSTILRKRENYREALSGFDPRRVARFTAEDQARLLANPGIVRNRLKIAATVENARLFLEIQQEHDSFDRYLWAFVGGQPIAGQRRSMKDLPPRTELSDQISRDLHGRGLRFVGSTIVYAYLQAVGVVNDHLASCYRYRELLQQG